MARTEHAATGRQALPEQGMDSSMRPAPLEGRRIGVERVEGVAVLRPQHAGPRPARSAGRAASDFGEPPRAAVQEVGQGLLGGEGPGVVRPGGPAAQVHRPPQVPLGLGQVAELEERLAQGQPQRRLDLRPADELRVAVDLRRGPVEQLLDRDLLVPVVDVRVGLAEQVLGQESVDRLRLVGRRARRVPLGGDLAVLPAQEDQARAAVATARPSRAGSPPR